MNIISVCKKFYFEAILLIIIAMMYKDYFSGWLTQWSDINSSYAYAFFIFAFIVYFIKTNYEELINIPKNVDYKGLIFLILGLISYVSGIRTDISYLTCISLPLFVGGIILTLYGSKIFKKLLLPLILFTFAFPFFPLHRITIPLQNLSAGLTASFLNILGVDSHSQASLISVGDYKLSVIAGCSGLRSLTTFLFTGIIFTYFMKISRLKKVLFASFTIPLSVIMNVLRLSIVGFYALYNGYEGIEEFHDNLGIVVAVISISIMVVTAKFLENNGGSNEV
jgi:exosortase